MAHDLQWVWYDGQAWEWLGLGEGQPIVNNLILKLLIKFKDLAQRDEGQDLVEYALVVALIAFGATAGMGALAGGINNAFNTISTTLSTSIT
jgi:pilus assembly protein Flp/PilA